MKKKFRQSIYSLTIDFISKAYKICIFYIQVCKHTNSIVHNSMKTYSVNEYKINLWGLLWTLREKGHILGALLNTCLEDLWIVVASLNFGLGGFPDLVCSGLPDLGYGGFPDLGCGGFPDIGCGGFPDSGCGGFPDLGCGGFPDLGCGGFPNLGCSGFPD